MPFGCISGRNEKTYNCFSDITDKYEIGQLLCAKEFCEICLAREMQTDRLFVCKKFLKKDGRKVRRAAKNEIMILKMVNHPNILQLIDTFETKKEFYIIQELATGGDVFDWILQQGYYSEKDASNVIRQVLEAVSYLHNLHIVHRNLKLENLMYYNQNNHSKVVLRDFYLSCFESGEITEPCGTPEYLDDAWKGAEAAALETRGLLHSEASLLRMTLGKALKRRSWKQGLLHSEASLLRMTLGKALKRRSWKQAPEVVSRHRYGRPVDCWAVGVVMYILLSGNPPFYDENEEENSENHNRKIFRKILAGEYEFDSPYWDVISASAKDLVSRLMEMDQEQRITAQDALGHIWISGNAASERNLKEGVCAQIEKNFAKAKWRKAIRVTTFMQRLRAPGEANAGRLPVTPRSSMSVSHEVTVEACPSSPVPSPSLPIPPRTDRSPNSILETSVCEGQLTEQKEHGGP